MTVNEKNGMIMMAVTGAKEKGFVPVKLGAYTYALVYNGDLNSDIIFIRVLRNSVAQYAFTTRYAHLKSKSELRNYFSNLHTKVRDYRQFSLYHL